MEISRLDVAFAVTTDAPFHQLMSDVERQSIVFTSHHAVDHL